MPEDTQTGWTRLSSGMRQDTGRGGYEQFWGSIDSVDASRTVPEPGGRSVLTTLTYHYKDGRVVRERQRIHVVRQDGGSASTRTTCSGRTPSGVERINRWHST